MGINRYAFLPAGGAVHEMKNSMLFIQAPPWGVSAPPLGVAYLSAFLRSSGFDTEILDANIELYHSADAAMRNKWDTQDFEFWASGAALDALHDQCDALIEKIIARNAGIIGFSATFAAVPFINKTLAAVRDRVRNDAIIIIGGAGAHFKEIRSLFKRDLIDYFIIGDGEYPLACLLTDIGQGNPIRDNAKYLRWKDDPRDYATCLKASGENPIDIDDIPFPTFDECSLDAYTQTDLIPIISSRGCVRTCTFCCDAPLKQPYRCRSFEKVADEIRYHVKRYNRRRFEFCDLLINGDLRFLDSLCNRLIGMELPVCWGGQATVRSDMDAALFKKMKTAGCGGLTFGCESFSDNVLKLMRKGMTSQAARDTFIKAKDAGMRVEINLIVGFPGETEADLDATILFIKNNARLIDKINSVNICTIGPGIHIYDHLDEYNIDKSMITDWYAWFTRDRSNTIEVRTNRHKKLLAVCSGLHLEPVWQNVKK